MKRKMLIFLTLGCLLACLTMLVSPAFARFPDGIDPQVAKITINIKIHGTQVWQSYLDFVPIVDNTVTLKMRNWLYLRIVQLLGTNTLTTPFDKKASLWTFSLDITITSRPQPLTIHLESEPW